MTENTSSTTTPTAHTILYIEDDAGSRRLIHRMLTHAGFKVLLAEKGLQGVDMARKEKPDLILTDINLPDISGRELATLLRAEEAFDSTPIVALTAQGIDERDVTLAAGITGYITKPVDLEGLLTKVRFYLGGGQDKVATGQLTLARRQFTQEMVRGLELRIRELQEANESLRKLDKMKDAFIQITAHELRTPLTVVQGYSDLLKHTPSIRVLCQHDEAAKTAVDALMGAIERMNRMVNEVVTVSRIMSEDMQLVIAKIEPGRLVEGVIKTFDEPLKQRKITLHFNREGWPATVYGDNGLLKLVVNNLIGNAIKYTPDGGEIFVTAKTEGDHVHISVRDTGVGIAEEDRNEIFERFHTAGDPLLHSTSKTAFSGGGLGLGLTVCRTVVQAHGGRIWVESKGHDPETLPGSTFIVELPRVAPKGSPVSEAVEAET